MGLNELLANLDPKFRKKIGVASDAPEVEYAETSSLGLNAALNGGFVYGRQVLVWGSKSSAKSSMCLEMVAKEQAKGKVCAWIDAEMSYDDSWAKRLGVDSDNLIYSSARTVNDMTDAGIALMNAGVDIIVVDSITSLLPAIYFEKDSKTLKDLDQTKQIGAESRDMGNAVKMLNYSNNRVKPTLLVLISQARNNITSMYTSQQPTGGMATKYYSSTIIRLFSSESDSQAIKGNIQAGDRILQEKVGRRIRWEVQFSKTSPAFQSGEYDFYFRGDRIGTDHVGELVDMAMNLGYVKKNGSWLVLDGVQYHGRDKLVSELRSNQDIHDKIKGRIYGEQG